MRHPLIKFRDASLGPFDLYREMDHLVRNFFDGDTDVEGSNGVNRFTPQANLVENETQFEVSFDLPGVNADDVNVEVKDDELSIVGERKSETEDETKRYHRVERRYGTFRRTMTLPSQVDSTRITAEYKDGVLRVVLPKSEKVKPTKIEVKKG